MSCMRHQVHNEGASRMVHVVRCAVRLRHPQSLNKVQSKVSANSMVHGLTCPRVRLMVSLTLHRYTERMFLVEGHPPKGSLGPWIG